jgi:Uma2 family endonuclease
MSSTIPQFAISPVKRTLVIDPPLSDEELEVLCLDSQVAFERRKDGLLIMNPPTGMGTGDGNAEIGYQLRNWWVSNGRKGRTFDSSTGFFLNDGSMLSPDAAYVSAEQMKRVSQAELTKIPHLCPVFVIELMSKSDELADAKSKMKTWIENGAQLGWLIEPSNRRVYIYDRKSTAGGRSFSGEKTLSGEGPVKGFVLDLESVWRCFQI